MHSDIRKTIWFLWYQGETDMPEVVRMSLASWRQHNPDWELILLTDANLADYMDGKSLLGDRWSTIPRAAKSDLIRVHLLAKQGGVWVDASTVCNRPLNDWLPEKLVSGFFAFARPNKDRLISSWFMAAIAGNALVRVYEQAAVNFWQTVHPKTLLVRENKYVGLKGLAKRLYTKKPTWAVNSWFVKQTGISHYFWFHYLFEWLYNTNSSFAEVWNKTPQLSANGPPVVAFWLHKPAG